jgi:hypothetical protein
MTLIAFVLVVLAVCVLAAVFGRDSRPVERGHHRPNL